MAGRCIVNPDAEWHAPMPISFCMILVLVYSVLDEPMPIKRTPALLACSSCMGTLQTLMVRRWPRTTNSYLSSQRYTVDTCSTEHFIRRRRSIGNCSGFMVSGPRGQRLFPPQGFLGFLGYNLGSQVHTFLLASSCMWCSAISSLLVERRGNIWRCNYYDFDSEPGVSHQGGKMLTWSGPE